MHDAVRLALATLVLLRPLIAFVLGTVWLTLRFALAAEALRVKALCYVEFCSETSR